MRFEAFVAIGFVISLSACQGTAPPKAIGAPDISKIAVFFPIDGLVHGRGGEGTFLDPSVSHVVVDDHPTGTETILPIDTDGSFNFSIIGSSDDILEIAGARDISGTDRGEVAYIRVPPVGAPRPHFSCCQTANQAQGTCTPDATFKTTQMCLDAATGATPCHSIADCRTKNFEILPIDLGHIQVTTPDSEGHISIAGVVQSAGALVRLENRGQRGIGGRDPHIRLAQITDTSGVFKFKLIAARGDDEIVLQVLDLLGNKSPEAPLYVPDAALSGLDVIGAYPFDRLDNGKVGTVAVRFHPFGVDGRGICPDSTLDPILCFSGGLTHQMITLESLSFDEHASMNPRETPTSSTLINSRATEGDPLSETQRIVLVIDNSTNAAMTDKSPPRRFEAAKQFVRSMRKRDEVAIISYGAGTGGFTRELALTGSGTGDWSAQISAIDSLAERAPTGPSAIFAAIADGAKMLKDAGNSRVPGNIMVIAAADQEGTNSEASAAFDTTFALVQTDSESGFRGYGVYIVGIGIPAPVQGMSGTMGNRGFLEDIAHFSAEGRFVNLQSAEELDQAMGDAAGFLAGSYVLLYQMAIPDSVGKSARIRLSATVSIPDVSGSLQTATGTYEGPIRIDGSEQ